MAHLWAGQEQTRDSTEVPRKTRGEPGAASSIGQQEGRASPPATERRPRSSQGRPVTVGVVDGTSTSAGISGSVTGSRLSGHGLQQGLGCGWPGALAHQWRSSGCEGSGAGSGSTWPGASGGGGCERQHGDSASRGALSTRAGRQETTGASSGFFVHRSGSVSCSGSGSAFGAGSVGRDRLFVRHRFCVQQRPRRPGGLRLHHAAAQASSLQGTEHDRPARNSSGPGEAGRSSSSWTSARTRKNSWPGSPGSPPS